MTLFFATASCVEQLWGALMAWPSAPRGYVDVDVDQP